MVENQIAGIIDHTLLKPEATKDQIIQLCEEAKEYHFASVCVNSYWVPICAEQLKGSTVKVCTVIGFPLGATASEVKAFEAKQAIEQGATEVDMVINIGALKDQNDTLVEQDITKVVEAAQGHAQVKVIIETSLLTNEEKKRACIISKRAGADFVKTSTGFSTGGATIEDITLMRQAVGAKMGVKASGGIRNREAAVEMLKAGATRMGTSNGVAIVTGQDTAGQSY